MKCRKNIIYYFVFVLTIFISLIDIDVYAIPIPKSGGFDCTYKLKHADELNKKDHTSVVRIYGDSTDVSKINFYWINNCDTSSTLTPEMDCPYSDLGYAFNSNNSDKTYAYLNSSNLNISHFVSSNGKWTCPEISYAVEYGDDIQGVMLYKVLISGDNDQYSSVATLSSDDSINDGHGNYMNVNICTYSIAGSNFTGILDSNREILTFQSDFDNKSSVINYTSTSCPLVKDMYLCMSKTTRDWYMQYNVSSCNSGYEVFNVQDVQEESGGLDNTEENDPILYTCSYKSQINHYDLTISKYSNHWIVSNKGIRKKISSSSVGSNVMPSENCEDIFLVGQEKIVAIEENTRFTDSYIAQHCRSGKEVEQYCENGVCKITNPLCGSEVEGGGTCPSELKPAIIFIKKIAFNTLQILVPILLIVMGTIDFAKAVMSNDDKANKDAISRFIRRIVTGVLIFFIVTIVSFVMDMFAKTDVGKQNDWKACWNNID